MKKILLFASAMLISMVSMAASIDFSAQGYENAQVIESVTIEEGLVVTFDKGTNQNAPMYYNSGTAVRVYGGGTMTVTTTGNTISKIVLTYGTGDNTNEITTDCGTFATDTWTGSASSVTFTVGGTSKHRRIKVIEVTLGEGGSTPETPETPEEPETPAVPEGAITCAEAVAICEQTGSTATAEAYTVRGYITSIKYTWSEQYGTATFWIADTKDGGEVLQAFSCAPLTDADKVFAVGDYVELVGKLKKYQTTNEVERGTYTVITAADGGETPEPEPDPETPAEPEAKVVTVAEFIAAPEAKDVYYELTGTIGGTINTTYGNFDLTDETGTVYVYGLTKEFIAVGSTQNDKSYSSLGLKEGDKITIRGFRGSYNDKIEVMGAYFVKLVEAGSGTTPPTPPTPPVGDLVGDGTADNPYTVEDVIALNNTLSGKHYVKAYIVGQAVGQSFVDGLDTEAPFEAAADATQGTNIAIASSMSAEVANIIPVQLPKGALRDDFNLVENPEMLGKEVVICGDLIKYFGLTGIKNPTSIVVVEVGSGVEDVIVNEKMTKVIKNGQMYIIRDGKAYNVLGAQL